MYNIWWVYLGQDLSCEESGDVGTVQAEELELRIEGGNTLVTRIVDSSSPVERQDVAEEIRISIEEVLAGVGVEKEFLLVGTEQGVWKAIDGAAPRLEALPADVDAQSRVGGDSEGRRSALGGRRDRRRYRDRVG